MKLMVTWFAGGLLMVALAAPMAAQPNAAQDEAKLAEGEGRDLVVEKCTVCHDTARIRSTYRDEEAWIALVNNMIMRGADVNPEEAKTIVAYLFQHYGIH